MTETPALEKVRMHLTSLVEEVLRADQSFHVLTTIRSAGPAIAKENYADLFELLHSTLIDRFLLALSKVFDRDNRRHPVQSVASLLGILDREASSLPIRQRPLVLKAVGEWGDPGIPADPTDAQITAAVVVHYRASMPSLDLASRRRLDATLRSVRYFRDKRIAHSEAPSADDTPTVSWTEARKLLDWAKDFIATVGLAYLSTAYRTGSQRYLLEDDAMRAANAMARLFYKAGLADGEIPELQGRPQHRGGR